MFKTAVVKSEEIDRKVGDKKRRIEVETESENYDGLESTCAGISSASSSRARTETLISSLSAIFEVHTDDNYKTLLSSHLAVAIYNYHRYWGRSTTPKPQICVY